MAQDAQPLFTQLVSTIDWHPRKLIPEINKYAEIIDANPKYSGYTGEQRYRIARNFAVRDVVERIAQSNELDVVRANEFLRYVFTVCEPEIREF